MEKEKLIGQLKSSYPLERLGDLVGRFRAVRVLVIGDAIVDEYHFTTPKGRATKDPILSVDYVSYEAYAGGVFAIANHLSTFVDNVTMVTMLGDRDDRKDFILQNISKNINPVFFVKKNSPTTVKKRYLNALRNEKLFKVEYINDFPLSDELECEIVAFLERELPRHDLVVVGDFGHSIISEMVMRVLEAKSKFLALNVQSNSANLGFNFVTKYKSADYVTMDVPELWYAVSDRFSPVRVLSEKLHEKAGFKRFLITMGKDGVDYYNNGVQEFFPAFVLRPRDTVGAGDAVLAVTALFAHGGHDGLIPFIANCVGGIAVSYMGNKEFVSRDSLLSFVAQVYNGEKELNVG